MLPLVLVLSFSVLGRGDHVAAAAAAAPAVAAASSSSSSSSPAQRHEKAETPRRQHDRLSPYVTSVKVTVRIGELLSFALV